MMHGGIGKVIKPVGLSDSTGLIFTIRIYVVMNRMEKMPIQNIIWKGDNMKNKIYCWPSAFCVQGDRIWFIYGKVCILCCYNLKTEKTEIISEIPVDNIYKESLYQKIIYKDEKLYLIPAWGKNILIYDIIQKNFSTIMIPEYDGLMFCNAFLYDNRIICIPYAYPSIINIDTKFDVASVLVKLDTIKQTYKVSTFNMADNLEMKIAMVSPQSNKVFLYDVEHDDFNVENVSNNVDGYASVCFFEKFIAMKPSKSRYIDLYNPLSGEAQKMELLPDQMSAAIRQINRESILLDDSKGADIWIYSNTIMRKIHSSTIKNRKPYYSYKVGIYDKDSGLYFNNCDATFYRGFTNKSSFKMEITDEMKQQITEIKRKNRMEIEKENFFYSLEQFIDDVMQQDSSQWI